MHITPDMYFHDDVFVSARRLFDFMGFTKRSLLRQNFWETGSINRHVGKRGDPSLRTLKINRLYYPSRHGKDTFVAYIKLSGRWLEHAGFTIGTHIKVITIRGMVLIVPAHFYEPYPYLEVQK